MSNLVPTPRTDRNGRTVIRHMRPNDASTERKALPPASLPATVSSYVIGSVEQLVTEISSSVGEERDLVRTGIEMLDEIDPRFSDTLARLFTRPRTIGQVYMTSTLRMRLTSRNTAAMMVKKRYFSVPGIATELDAAGALLYEALFTKSISDLVTPEEYTKSIMTRHFKEGNKRFISSGILPAWDPFTVSSEEADRYFRPLSVATALLSGDGGVLYLDDDFEDDASKFIAWAGAQEDMDKVLFTALEKKTLDPTNIRDFITMQSDTTLPLQDGLL